MLLGESWKVNNNLEWERVRYLATITKNAGLVARGTKVNKTDLVEPTDMFELPQDKIYKNVKGLPKSDLKTFKAFYEKAVKSGVKFNKTPDFNKLKEDHK